jgi:hypothetical protein
VQRYGSMEACKATADPSNAPQRCIPRAIGDGARASQTGK